LWSNVLVLESTRSGYRLPRPSTMPADLYEHVVLPCWKSNNVDDDGTSSMLMSATGSMGNVSREPLAGCEHSFELRPTFAELTSRLGRLCFELQKHVRTN
jgi:hypothetical protein